MFDLGTLTKDYASTSTWLRERDLMYRGIKCEGCRLWKTEVLDKDRKLDGHNWKCFRCKQKTSVREGSFFQQSHLKLATIVRIMYLFVMNVPLMVAKQMLGGEVGKTCLMDWYNFMRDICTSHLPRHPVRLGGAADDEIVEVDESLYKRKNKYHRGADRGGGHWIFGCIERKSSKVMMWSVPNRERQTIQPLIEQAIIPGTMIFSDCAKIYDNLNVIGYRHEAVNHSVEFVRPDGVNTNKIEGFWGNSECKFKSMRGVVDAQLDIHLDEAIWRNNRAIDAKNQGPSLFGLFAEDVKEAYPCVVDDPMPPGYNIMPRPRYGQ